MQDEPLSLPNLDATIDLRSRTVDRARRLAHQESRFGDSLGVAGWVLLDRAIEATLRDAEDCDLFEEVWDIFFPHNHADSVLRGMPHNPHH